MTASKQATANQGKLYQSGMSENIFSFEMVRVSVLLSIHFRAIVIIQSVKCLLHKLEDVTLVPNTYVKAVHGSRHL